jgi:hypothetical protein
MRQTYEKGGLRKIRIRRMTFFLKLQMGRKIREVVRKVAVRQQIGLAE